MKIVFAKRPTLVRPSTMTVEAALRHTAKNGKALRLNNYSTANGMIVRALRDDGLILHRTRRGKFILAWCENGTKKKGSR